ncbi:Peptidyl-prolyl cis-trans isomerase FKBP53 [Linum perenne]
MAVAGTNRIFYYGRFASGIEVKPGESRTYESENENETLYITQATLGVGSSTERTILQCSVDEKSPVFLCSLLPEKTESCTLNLVFRDDEVVSFSVVGETSVHISGYVAVDEAGILVCREHGEDIAETESDESTDFEYDDEDEEDDFIDDEEDEGFNVFGSSPARKSGVVIEEIVDDEEPEKGKKKDKKKKNKKKEENESVVESEDEDGFPVSATVEEAKQDKGKESKKKKKRKVKGTEADNEPEKKKKKKQVQKSKEETDGAMDEDDQKEQPADTIDGDERKIEGESGSAAEKSSPAKKQKKKKNKKVETTIETAPAKKADEAKKSSIDEKQSPSKYSKERKFPSGLVVEDLALGKPNAKKASPGSQVSVRYIGKLQKNGKIFDSNVGKFPFKFKLGAGQVIKGWDVGVNGMRVGDKRKLTIPPSMGYGQQRAGSIPPNSWLVFDVEMVNVR